MKVENDPTFATQSAPLKSYNPFDSDDEHTHDLINSYPDTYDLKRFENNVGPLALNLDDDNMSWEEAILHHSSKSAPIMNDEEVLPSKDGELFTDKTVINGAKENFHHTVKDIGVDEGLPKHDKESNVEKVLTKGKHSANPFETEFLTKIDEFKHELNKKESDLKTQDEVNYVEVDEKENGDSKKESVDDVPLEYVKESFIKPSIMNTTEVMKSRETQEEEATTLESSEHSTEVELGNIVLDSKSSTNSEGDVQNGGYVKPPKMQTVLRNEGEAIGVDRCVSGENSFSLVLPPHASSLTSMARSGSISLRSESSTGSTRSFAFPVLQTEWNSSPVRMAKPDPKHRQKHRGWVQSLICCKF